MSTDLGFVAKEPRMCRGKRRFNTLAQATKNARRMYHANGDAAHGYPCSICKGYHVGGVTFGSKVLSVKRPRVSEPHDFDEIGEYNVDGRVLARLD